MKRIAVFFLALGFVLLSANAFAQKGKEPPKQKPVIIEEKG